MHPYVAEFVGALLLVLLGNGVVANVVLPQTKGHNSGWIVITIGWGMAVFVAVWCVGPFSGAHINPAVTIGLAVSGGFKWSLVAGYITAQMLGAIVGAVLVYVFYRDHFRVSDDAGAKLAAFSNTPAIRRTSSNLFSEMVGTAILVFAILMAAEPTLEVAGETGSTMTLGLGTIGALPVGLLVFAIGLSLGGTTGYAINPARDLAKATAIGVMLGFLWWGQSWAESLRQCCLGPSGR